MVESKTDTGGWDIVSGIGKTALFVAASRAIESHRDDKLVDDPWATRFVEAASSPPMFRTEPYPASDNSISAQWQLMSSYMGVRSLYFDRYFAAAAQAGIRQVVVLGAGLDSRAYRLDWPADMTIYEIDQPRVLEFKSSVYQHHDAQSQAVVRTVPMDLRDDWVGALVAAGFDASRPTAWLAEGLLPYLPVDAEIALLTHVNDLSAPGSRIAVEAFDGVSEMVDDPQMDQLASELGFSMTPLLGGGDRIDVDEWLHDVGWQVTVDAMHERADSYGREFDPFTTKISGNVRLIEGARPAA